MSALAEATGAQIVPVDSEHSALYQLIGAERPGTVDRLVLAARAPLPRPHGPRRGHARAGARPSDLGHGRPDHRRLGHADEQGAGGDRGASLFGVPYEAIDVVVHPQSLVHALVHLNDGSSLAHLGYPDMRVPISYALHHPERADVPVETLDLGAVGEYLRAAGRRDFRLPAARLRGRPRRRHRALRPERRRRGGARLPEREDRLPRHRPPDRARTGRGSAAARPQLRRPLRGGRRGARAGAPGRGGRRRELGPRVRGLRPARDPARAGHLHRRQGRGHEGGALLAFLPADPAEQEGGRDRAQWARSRRLREDQRHEPGRVFRTRFALAPTTRSPSGNGSW